MFLVVLGTIHELPLRWIIASFSISHSMGASYSQF